MAKEQKPTPRSPRDPKETPPVRPISPPEETERPAFTPGRGVDQDLGVEDEEDHDDPHPARRGNAPFNVRLVAVTGTTVITALVLLIAYAAVDRPEVRPVQLGGIGGLTVALNDTARTDTTSALATLPRRNLPELGETLRISITAADDPLNPIRITEEGDVRRPYWVERGDSISFPMRERIIIEEPEEGRNEIQQARIRINGVPYPANRVDGRGRLIITRDAVESYFDQLRRGVQ